MQSLTSEELIEVLRSGSDSYTQRALEIASVELATRPDRPATMPIVTSSPSPAQNRALDPESRASLAWVARMVALPLVYYIFSQAGKFFRVGPGLATLPYLLRCLAALCVLIIGAWLLLQDD